MIVLTTVITLPGHIRQLFVYSQDNFYYNPPMIALASGLRDREVIHFSAFRKFQEADNRQVLKEQPFLFEHKKAVYATRWFRQIGTQIPPNKIVKPETDQTNINTIANVKALKKGGYQWQGTTPHCDNDGIIAVIDASGTVLGSGMVSRQLPPTGINTLFNVFRNDCSATKHAEWIAYLPPETPPGISISAVSVLKDKAIIIAEAITH